MNEFDFDYQEKRENRRAPWGFIVIALILVAVTAFLTYSLTSINNDRNMAALNDGNPIIQKNAEALITPAATSVNPEPAEAQTSEEASAQRPQTAPALGGPIPQLLGNGNGVSEVVEKIADTVVGIETSYEKGGNIRTIGSGSGFIITADGYIVTNAHVIESGNKFKVHLTDNEILDAVLVGSDSASDIAVLKIEKTGLTPASLGDSSKLKVGEIAIVIGNPLEEALYNSVSMGIISGLNREITSNMTDFSRVGISLIQTDAAVNPGNSGGPLVNINGQVVGITTAKSFSAGVSETGTNISSEGIGFAIPISDAKTIIEKLIVDGNFERGGLGVTLALVDADTAKENNVPEGVTIASVYADSPAEKAGLKEGDVVTAADGKKIAKVEELTQIVLAKSSGDTVKLTISRDSNTQDISVTLGSIDELAKAQEQEQSNSQPQPNQQEFFNGNGDWNNGSAPWWFSW